MKKRDPHSAASIIATDKFSLQEKKAKRRIRRAAAEKAKELREAGYIAPPGTVERSEAQ